jgi:hypothetical protein
MIHAMAIDKQKALHLSGKPVLATWASNITYLLLLLHSEYWDNRRLALWRLTLQSMALNYHRLIWHKANTLLKPNTRPWVAGILLII